MSYKIKSIVEEALAALWLIAALLALLAGIDWLAVFLFGKAAIDTVVSVCFAVMSLRDGWKEKR